MTTYHITKPLAALLLIGCLSFALANAALWLDAPFASRVVVALLFLFVWPGMLLLAVIFPHHHSLAPSERIVLSVGLSIALSVVLLWWLCWSPLNLSLRNVVGVFDMEIVMLAALAAWRARQTAAPKPTNPSLPRRERRFLLLLGLLALFSLGWVLTHLDFGDLSGDERSVVVRALDVLVGRRASLFSLTKGPAQIVLVVGMMRFSDSFLEWVVRLPFALCAVIANLTLALFARRRLRLSSIAFVGALFITEGMLLGMARWVQYQMFALAMMHLALYCGWRGYATRRSSPSGRYWWLAALFGAVGLVGHYDAGLIAPALLYLFVKSRQPHLLSRRVVGEALALGLTVLLIAAPFYILFTQQGLGLGAIESNYVNDRVNLGQGPFNHFNDFLMDLWDYGSAYRVVVVFALVTIAGIRAIAQRNPRPRWLVPLLLFCAVGTLLTALFPAALSIGHVNVSFAPFLLLCALFAGKVVRDVFWMAVLWWVFAVFAFTSFMMNQPFDHYFCGLPALLLIAGRGLQDGWRFCANHLSRARRLNTARVASALLLAWFIFIAGYAYMVNIAYYPALLLIHPERNLWWYSQLSSPRQSVPAYYVSSVGWRAVAALYQLGELRGEHDGTVESVREYYLNKIWEPPKPALRYFFVARPQKPGFLKKEAPPDLPDTHDLWGVLTVDGEPQIQIYQRKERTPSSARVLAAEDYEPLWAGMASLNRLEWYKSHQRDDSAFYAVAQVIKARSQPQDALVVDTPTARALFNQFNNGALPFLDVVSDTRLDAYRRVWGIFWANNPEQVERELALRAYPSTTQWIGNVRLRMYAVARDAPLSEPMIQVGEVATLLKASQAPSTVRAGELLPLQLVWRAEQPTSTRYKVFAHVTNVDGTPLAQSDDEPMAGLRPTNIWRPNETTIDRIGIWLPANLKAGRYQIVIGMYDPTTGVRLPAIASDGKPYANDAVPLGDIAVVGN